MDKYLKCLLVSEFVRHLVGWIVMILMLAAFLMLHSCATTHDPHMVQLIKRSRFCTGPVVDYRTMQSQCEIDQQAPVSVAEPE